MEYTEGMNAAVNRFTPPLTEALRMSVKMIVLLVCVSLGGWLGWVVGTPGGIMGSYLAGVVGSSAGLYIGRRLQGNLDGD